MSLLIFIYIFFLIRVTSHIDSLPRCVGSVRKPILSNFGLSLESIRLNFTSFEEVYLLKLCHIKLDLISFCFLSEMIIKFISYTMLSKTHEAPNFSLD